MCSAASRPHASALRFIATTSSPLRPKKRRIPSSIFSIPMPRIGDAAPSSTTLAARGTLFSLASASTSSRMTRGKRFRSASRVVYLRVVRNVDERRGVGHDPARVGQVRQVAQRFHRFERQDQVSPAAGDQVGTDRFGRDPQVRLYVAAPLAHAVHFGLLDMQLFFQGRFADDRCDREDALAPYSGQNDI